MNKNIIILLFIAMIGFHYESICAQQNEQVPNAELGHCFIIDAYEEEVKTYSLRYRYIVEQPLEGQLYRITGDNYRIEIRVNPPVLYKYKMNWGGHSSYNNLSFTPAGSWEISDCIYDDNRNIIVGYQQI